jgi:FdhD protein
MHRSLDAVRLGRSSHQPIACRIAEETPIGVLYNGIAHAVVMATPADLDDFAIGTSLTDGICGVVDIERIETRKVARGIELDVRLSPVAFAGFLQLRRARTQRSYTSCGLCGVESLEDVPRIHKAVPQAAIDPAAIRRALAALPQHQRLHQLTGAAHAAAWAGADGKVRLVREDVGRHTALDKLIGARAQIGNTNSDGFCVLTSRCSYEMVQKSAAAGIGLLVCISAPTTFAIEEAERLGIGLIAMARADSQIVYAGAHTVEEVAP